MNIELPLGELLKKDIRKIAKENNFVNASKKDSTGICFIGDRKYNDFVGQFLQDKKGKIITVDGEKIGEHNGHMYFTVGQRKGLGIGARSSAYDEPWYVVNKDINKNIVFVAQGANHLALFSNKLLADKMHWNLDISKLPLLKCKAKVRYRDVDHSCQILSSNEDECYICIGGGIIRKRNIPYLSEEINE